MGPIPWRFTRLWRSLMVMFKFLLGVAFGAAGYWAWQSFGRDLLGLGSDQDTYGGYSSSSSFGSGTSSGTGSFGSSGATGASSIGGTASTPSTAPTSSSTSSDTPSSSTS
jgi:hypothetical protein